MGDGDSLSAHIDPADNGFIVRTSKTSNGKNPNSPGKYSSKQLVATDYPSAIKIASGHFTKAIGKPKMSKKGGTTATKKMGILSK